MFKSVFVLWISIFSAVSNANPVSPSDLKCSLSYSEYSKHGGLKEIWKKPLTQIPNTRSFHLKVDHVPMKSKPSVNLQVTAYGIPAHQGLHDDIGLDVEDNHMQIDANLRTIRPSIRYADEANSLCYFRLTWNEFPQNENGVWSQWLSLYCSAPVEYCEFSAQD
ncbi:MAG: hypothetical protein ACXWRE_04790 [Pseudobdellovibrionaceae bacterium]